MNICSRAGERVDIYCSYDKWRHVMPQYAFLSISWVSSVLKEHWTTACFITNTALVKWIVNSEQWIMIKIYIHSYGHFLDTQHESQHEVLLRFSKKDGSQHHQISRVLSKTINTMIFIQRFSHIALNQSIYIRLITILFVSKHAVQGSFIIDMSLICSESLLWHDVEYYEEWNDRCYHIYLCKNFC